MASVRRTIVAITGVSPWLWAVAAASGARADGPDPAMNADPVAVLALPFHDARTTLDAPSLAFDRYDCAPDVDESGPEWVYAVTVADAGILRAALTVARGADVDVQLLDGDGHCVARGDSGLSALVPAGDYRVVVDTFSDRGKLRPGSYDLAISHVAVPTGRCAMDRTHLPMFWRGCDAGAPCSSGQVDGKRAVFAELPGLGGLAKESHLVTTADDFHGSLPSNATDRLAHHYATSQKASGYRMTRHEPWSSAVGNPPFGRPAYGRPLPPVAETWYVNMYWLDRPEPGTKMILYNPENGRAVVAAAGYETGPASNALLGGASEECHQALGTHHGGAVVMGFATDQSLPFGPIDCGS